MLWIHNMGTSKSYSGPTGQNPLIPPWAEVPMASDEGVPQEDGSKNVESAGRESGNVQGDPNASEVVPSTLTPWGDVKANFTRYAKSPYSSPTGSARKVSRSFVRAQGGAKRAATNARQGKNAAKNMGGILSGLSGNGKAFVYEGFDFRKCVGKKSSELLGIFVDLIIGENGDIESTITRKAVTETFQKIFEMFQIDENGLDALKNLSLENSKIIFETYLSEYIAASMLHKIGQILEKLPPNEALQKEKWMKNYIKTKVKLNLSSVDLAKLDWKGREGKDFVQNVFGDAFKLMETT